MEQPPPRPVASPQTDRNSGDSPQLALGNATGLAPPAWGVQGQPPHQAHAGCRGSHGADNSRCTARPHLNTSPRACQHPPWSQRAQGMDSRAPAGPTAASPGVNPRVPGTVVPTPVQDKPRLPQPRTHCCSPHHSDSSPSRTTSLPSEQLPGHKSVAQPAFKEIH